MSKIKKLLSAIILFGLGLMLFGRPAMAQHLSSESWEYKTPSSTATVRVEIFTASSGHVTANILLRDGDVEKNLAMIESHQQRLHGRQIAFPSNPLTPLSPKDQKSYTSEGALADSLARGGLPNRYLLISVPETSSHDRLMMIDLQNAEAELHSRSEFQPQEILVPKDSPDIQRTYSVKSVAAPERHKPTAPKTAGGTMLSIADVDRDGKIATFGTGLVVHQMFFLMDKNFTNLAAIQQPLALRDNHSFEIIDSKADTTKTAVKITARFRSLGIHHSPRHLPEFDLREGRIDQSARFGGPIHPQIIETICRQGSNGILALPYLPLESRKAGPVANLFDSFQPEYRADMTIEQASLLPRIEISNRETVEAIRNAILIKSDITLESQTAKAGLRRRQEKGLQTLAAISSDFPPALEALKAIREATEADSTLKLMTNVVINAVERETKRSPKSQKAYKSMLNDVMDSARCVRAFVPVSGL